MPLVGPAVGGGACIVLFFRMQKFRATLASRLISARHYSQNLANPGYFRHDTHPHLLGPGEVAPGIPAHELVQRRKKLFEMIPHQDALVVLKGYGNRYRTGKIFYDFFQNTNLLYLTGLEEPNVVVVLHKSSATDFKYLAFIKEPNQHDFLWEGQMICKKGAVEHFGADEAHDISEFADVFRKLVTTNTTVYLDTNRSDDSSQHSVLGETQFEMPKNRRPLSPLISQLRLIKSPIEQLHLKKAASIACQGFTKIMRHVHDFQFENDIVNEFEYHIKCQGARSSAYVPVCAGRGANACVIHYTRNNMPLLKSDLALVDAGAYYNGYCSDITRTFPLSGRFSKFQKQLYEALYEIQVDIVENQCRAGNTLTELLHYSADQIQTKICRDLFGVRDRSKSRKLTGLLYPHHVSHHLGMDVHDCKDALMGPWNNLQPDMCITVEPGVYIPHILPGQVDDLLDVIPKEFRGIGIRIEDDILIKSDHSVNLTAGAPKSISDIESAMSNLQN